MCNVKAKMAGGKLRLKYSPKHTAPQPDKQASQAKRLGFAIVTLDGMTDTPLKRLLRRLCDDTGEHLLQPMLANPTR